MLYLKCRKKLITYNKEIKMKKTDYIKILAKLMVGNWVLTGYRGDIEKAKASREKQLRVFTVAELKIKIDNLTIL